MTKDNLAVVAARERTHPALRKLARAYIALAHQLHGTPRAAVPASDEASAQSKETAE
jgi:hypothetical protein